VASDATTDKAPAKPLIPRATCDEPSEWINGMG